MENREDAEILASKEIFENKDCAAVLVPEIKNQCNQPTTTDANPNGEDSFVVHFETADQLKLNMDEDRINCLSPRESLGILNFSDMDFGRESMQIFNLNPQYDELPPTNSISVNNANETITITNASNQNQEYSSSIYLNKGFRLSRSIKFSDYSSILSNTSEFNSKSLNEPSPIFPLNVSQRANIKTSHFKFDQFNDAFINSSIIFARTSSLSTIQEQTTEKALEKGKFRNRICSLPVNLEKHSESIQSEDQLENSVFFENNKEDGAGDDDGDEHWKNFDENNFIDAIQEPDWPKDIDVLSISGTEEEKQNVCEKEAIKKKIDLMFGKANDKDKGPNVSESSNILSKTDVVHQTESQNSLNTNLSQNASNSSKHSNENAFELIRNLSDILKSKENMSLSRKNEFLVSLSSLADELSNGQNEVLIMSEDSGHSSIGCAKVTTNNHSEVGTLIDIPAASNNSEQCGTLDLPDRKEESCEEIRKLLTPVLPAAPKKTLSPYSIKSSKCNRSLTFQSPPADSAIPKLCSSRNSIGNKSNNISSKKIKTVPKTTSTLMKIKKPIANGKGERGPLRATLPLGSVAKPGQKVASTPEKKLNMNSIQSARTSTPIKEPNLKPMLTSTPITLSQTDIKPDRIMASNSSRNKSLSQDKINSLNLSFKNYNNETNNDKNHQSTTEKIKIKRMHSAPEMNPKSAAKPKITSTLAKVRQTISNSPYYSATSGKELERKETSILSTKSKPIGFAKGNKSFTGILSKKSDKENIEP